MSRKDILDFINEVIVNNHGTASTEDMKLADVDIDSFAFAVFFLEIEEEYDIDLGKAEDAGELKSITIGELITRIQECL